MTKLITAQEKFWTSSFGKNYIKRNYFTNKELDDLYLKKFNLTRSALNKEFLGKFNEIELVYSETLSSNDLLFVIKKVR